MKNISIALNIVLTIAVGVLFFLHFSSSPKCSGQETTEGISVGEKNIAYIDIDSLINKYDLFYDLQSKLVESQKKSESELNSKSQAFEKEATDFQNKVQKGLITRAQAEEMQKTLMAKEQNLYALRDQLRIKLQEEEQVMMRQLRNSIDEFLVEYNKNGQYSYILSYTFGGPVLLANKNLNITNSVIEGINKSYQKTK